MNIEEVLSTTHRISPRERVPFHCTCCGECCRHVRQSVPLESPDVFRLTRLLREKDKGIICMDDFIARYTELALLDECGYFMLMLKVTGVDDACIFSERESVYGPCGKTKNLPDLSIRCRYRR